MCNNYLVVGSPFPKSKAAPLWCAPGNYIILSSYTLFHTMNVEKQQNYSFVNFYYFPFDYFTERASGTE